MSRKTEAPSRVKQEIKEEGKDFDSTLNPRERLKGALQQLVHSDNSTDSEEFQKSKFSIKKIEKERRDPLLKKKKHRLIPTKDAPNAFVMKLFDRSVDLAQFEENTPLYPICRAWIANTPRSFATKFKETLRKSKKEERKLKQKIEDGTLKEIYSFPTPALRVEPLEVACRPPEPSSDFTLDADTIAPGKDILLATHVAHWRDVKKKVRQTTFRNERRFEAGKKTLRRIYQSAQKSFE